MQILSNPISALRESPTFSLHKKSGSRNTMLTSDFSPEVEIRPIRSCAMKNTQYNPYLWPNLQYFRVLFGNRSVSRNTTVTFDFRPEVEIRPFRACAMHSAIINGTVLLLWTWLYAADTTFHRTHFYFSVLSFHCTCAKNIYSNCDKTQSDSLTLD